MKGSLDVAQGWIYGAPSENWTLYSVVTDLRVKFANLLHHFEVPTNDL